MVGEGSIAATSAFGKWKEGRLFREQTEDMIAYGIDHYEKVFAKTKSRGGFLINEKYSRKDACRILDWPKDESSTLYGYRIKNGSCPIFVTYKKREDIAKSTMASASKTRGFIFPAPVAFAFVVPWIVLKMPSPWGFSMAGKSTVPIPWKHWRRIRLCRFLSPPRNCFSRNGIFPSVMRRS